MQLNKLFLWVSVSIFELSFHLLFIIACKRINFYLKKKKRILLRKIKQHLKKKRKKKNKKTNVPRAYN